MAVWYRIPAFFCAYFFRIARSQTKDREWCLAQTDKYVDPAGYCYAYYGVTLAFSAAKSACEDVGGQLPVVFDLAERAKIGNLVLEPSGKGVAWVGLVQDDGMSSVTDGWNWIDRFGLETPFVAERGKGGWGPDNPEDYKTDMWIENDEQNHGSIYKSGLLEDSSAPHDDIAVICQYFPPNFKLTPGGTLMGRLAGSKSMGTVLATFPADGPLLCFAACMDLLECFSFNFPSDTSGLPGECSLIKGKANGQLPDPNYDFWSLA